ncbi:MAG: 4-(cytidine 5'-diphospho)-2-C-methyl-D-erythritol kinase [Luteimonas sp.]
MAGEPADGWSTWPAPAKLNLFLRITGRRDDGYHDLQTAFRLLDWGDTVRLRTRGDGAVVRHGVPLAGVPGSADLLLRAARLLQQAAGVGLGADIGLEKRIPIGGGFGGGSSDAATVLLALNRLWGAGLDTRELAELGLGLGADVPVFVHGHSAWAEGVGEQLAPLELPPAWYLVADPGVRVATAELFQVPELTRNAAPATISDFLSGAPLGNAFEPVLRRREPAVEAAFAALARVGAARLTGTGSGCFVEFATREAAEAARAALPPGLRAWTAAGVARSPLLQTLESSAPQGRRQEVQGTGF